MLFFCTVEPVRFTYRAYVQRKTDSNLFEFQGISRNFKTLRS